MRCAEARGRLQELRDGGGAPAGKLAAHLAACAACREFRQVLEGIGVRTRAVLDDAAAGLARPDYAAIRDRGELERRRGALRRARFRLASVSAAAVVAAGIGIASGVRAWIGRRDLARMASRVDEFVEELFAEPLLADAGFPLEGDGAGFRDWLEGSGAAFLP